MTLSFLVPREVQLCGFVAVTFKCFLLQLESYYFARSTQTAVYSGTSHNGPSHERTTSLLGDFWFWAQFLRKSVKYRDTHPNINPFRPGTALIKARHEQQEKSRSFWGQFETTDKQNTRRPVRQH